MTIYTSTPSTSDPASRELLPQNESSSSKSTHSRINTFSSLLPQSQTSMYTVLIVKCPLYKSLILIWCVSKRKYVGLTWQRSAVGVYTRVELQGS